MNNQYNPLTASYLAAQQSMAQQSMAQLQGISNLGLLGQQAMCRSAPEPDDYAKMRREVNEWLKDWDK